MSDRLSTWIQEAQGRRVLLVGDLILDRYVYGDAERISPEAPVPVLRTVEKHEAVGGAANVASCLVALGCDVTCCGTIGQDLHGQRLQALMEELGVSTDAMIALPDRPTTTKTRLVGLAQHRHRQQLLRVDEEDSSPLSPQWREELQAAACRAVSSCDVVCLEDYDKGLFSRSLVEAVLAEATKQGKPLLVDPARLGDYERYRGVPFITPNRQELALACGRSFDSLEALAAGASELMEAMQIGTVIATVDRDGSILVSGGGEWQHFPTTPRSVYDNTGAGDAVLAMLAASMAGGAPPEDAIQLANLAGGLEVEKFGCVPITTEEILAEIRLHSRQQNGKLKSAGEVAAELALRRDRGETIVFTNGCFDILHAGHVDYLRRSRQEGSILVVGLNSDESVRTLEKGDDRPINTFSHRAMMLGALECVDYVVGFEEPTPEKLIHALKPDILTKGEDYAGKEVVGADVVLANGGRVALIPLIEGLSTSALVDRIRGAASFQDTQEGSLGHG
ncbi:MAG: D-glycero-beta-D-manno-heptose 1-phosphate adenylyltransferase [Phycisphaerae bacterium]